MLGRRDYNVKKIMLEDEMEQYCIDNELEIFEGEERLLDSTLVIEHAINLGYESYLLDGEGDFDQTLVFI